MKNSSPLFLLLFLSSLSFCQQRITGIIKDTTSKEPLPFATIFLPTGEGVITDMEGKFEWELPSGSNYFTVSYVGYAPKTVLVQPNLSFYLILLDETTEKLSEVVVVGGENPAVGIIRKAIETKDKNNPEKALKTFRFNTYSRLLVSANPDSINGALDSIYKIEQNGVKKLVKIDSSNFELKNRLNNMHLYITEKVSEYTFSREKGRRETILATRMAGFKDPVYEVLAIQLQSFSFYENNYVIFGTTYTNPLANEAMKVYDYKILDTLTAQERPSYMIYYKPKKKGKTAGLEGLLYIDAETFALQKAIAQLKAVIDVNAEQVFEYYPGEKVWFPLSKHLQLKKGASVDAISLFGNAVQIQPEIKAKDSTVVRSNPQNPSDFMYLVSTEKNSDISVNIPLEIKGRGLAMELHEKASQREGAFWNAYRTDSLTARGVETYRFIDSVAAKEKIERKIVFARKLLQGFYPTRYIDLDLRYLLKYNGYEGFRIGIGGVTNTTFSQKYQWNGYIVYGTKDKTFKYSVGAAVRIQPFTQSWLGIFYTDDLVETGSSFFITDGRSFSLFEPRLFNIERFHATQTMGAYLLHDVTAKLQTRLQFTTNSIAPTYNYTFNPNGTPYTNFKTAAATLALQWNPFSEYLSVPGEKREIKKGYPQFTLQVTQGFKGVLEGNFNFTKYNLRSYYETSLWNRTLTSFLLEGAAAFGDLPLTELYHNSPNNPNKTTLLKRFSVAGRNSFETMYFNEFFSDRYAFLQVKHQLKPFAITHKFQPQLVVASRFALGNVAHIERHSDVTFSALNKGFLESGFEINKLFKGLGVSLFYRYGAYHLPRFEDNISFKFTFYLSLF